MCSELLNSLRVSLMNELIQEKPEVDRGKLGCLFGDEGSCDHFSLVTGSRSLEEAKKKATAMSCRSTWRPRLTRLRRYAARLRAELELLLPRDLFPIARTLSADDRVREEDRPMRVERLL